MAVERHLLLPFAFTSSLVVACGPPRVAGDGDEGSEAETGEESTTDGEPDLPADDESESEGETDDFLIDPDTFEWHACDPYLQDCPRGEKCVPYSSAGDNWDALKCVPVLGDQAVGEPCVHDGVEEATDNCDASGYCWDMAFGDDENIGTCYALCTGSPDEPECPVNSTCLFSGVLRICIPDCDPLAQDCGEGEACYLNGSRFSCAPIIDEPSALGEPCVYINHCELGTMCIDAAALPECAGDGCCAAFCDLSLGLDQCDAPGTECVAFFPDNRAPPGYEDVGICVLP